MEQMSQKSGSGTVNNHELNNPGNHPSPVFDEIRQEIGKINPHAETIEQTYHLRKFAELFRRLITNDQLLNDLFLYLNEEALSNAMFAIQFAIVFASHQLADASFYETKVRNAMIATLQQNFLSIERLKQENIHRFYNSVTLLGEYYHRKRVAFCKRIHILGQSLLLLLTSELEQEISKCCQQPGTYRFQSSLAKLVLAQIILNGQEVKEEHKKEVQDLLYTVRKALIIIPNLCEQTKALLLMTLDIYFGHIAGLDKLYGKYLKEPSSAEVQAEADHSVDSPILVNGNETPKENGVETVQQPTANDTHKPSVTGVKAKENDTSGQKSKGAKAGTSDRSSGRSGKASNQHNTTNDKENKKRSQTKSTPVDKTSPKSTSGTDKRSIRLHEDGNIVATITRRDTPATAPTSPAKKHPIHQPQQPSNTVPPRSSTSRQKLSPRTTEKLAALPKITVTGATPSPKRTQDKHQLSSNSSRPVLGPSIAKQKSHPPPKSPTTPRTDSRQGQPPAARTKHDRNVRGQEHRGGTKAEQQNNTGGDVTRNTRTNVDHQSSNHTPYTPELQNSEPLDWSIVPEQKPETVCTSPSSRDKDTEAYETTNGSPTSPYYYEQDDPLTGMPEILIESMAIRQVNPQTTSFLSFLARD
ncbi:uncharacterized protein LOC126561844 [Anopheles maculipalpis]|uniref:uncharacterized protein LOC126561844 n=1 Tax=Anopheles maculipalpis TaxID=1496333 RepID=UPI002158BE92|nr:uncharacterized protein LOC126561844 [Anopheles maculipalpis]